MHNPATVNVMSINPSLIGQWQINCKYLRLAIVQDAREI